MRHALALVAILIPALSSAAHAQAMVTASAPESIVAVLQSEGLQAKLGKDNLGDPIINSAAAGANFDVFFYDCAAGKDCGSVQFSACFDLKNGSTVELMNEWNTEMRYGKADLGAESDPCLKMDVEMIAGLPQATFQEVLRNWTAVLGKYVVKIDY